MGDGELKAIKMVIVGAITIVGYLIWQGSIVRSAFEEVCQSYASMVEGYIPFDRTELKLGEGYEFGVSRLDRDPKAPVIFKRPSGLLQPNLGTDALLARMTAEFEDHERKLSRPDEFGYAYRDWWSDVEQIRENCQNRVQISF